ncbi:MAG TPA: polysaccharide deacetylase family protein [Ilumatobacteraceae bacterium]|nr:polysaccharide deacetylase family protein [Ilumatobacteraceae bacterium]
MSSGVISIHDVAPATRAECSALLATVERVGARASLLVISGPWREPMAANDPAFVEWLLAAESRGHEIVAHGWEHRAVSDPALHVGVVRRLGERLLTRGCSEFAALGAEEASVRACKALVELRLLGADPTGFIAPGWSMSGEALSVLGPAGFGYTTTRLTVIDLDEPKSLPIPAVCHRPKSVLTMLAARMLVSVVALRCREQRSIRLALHPDDIHDPRLVRATEQAIETLAASALQLMTYAELIAACRRGPPVGRGEPGDVVGVGRR